MTATVSALVAERVCALRKARGWNRQDLAAQCAQRGHVELTTAAIVNIETGRPGTAGRRRCITVDELTVFAEVFGISTEQLLSADCAGCKGCPPAGFICATCGAGAS